MYVNRRTCASMRLRIRSSARGYLSMEQLSSAICTLVNSCPVLARDQSTWVHHSTGNDDGVLSAYRRLIAEGKLEDDVSQAKAAQTLQLLQQVIRDSPLPSISLLSSTDSTPDLNPSGARSGNGITAPQPQHAIDTAGHAGVLTAPALAQSRVINGAYLYGHVGSGKTMLMDLFQQTLGCYTSTPAAPLTTAAAAATNANPPHAAVAAATTLPSMGQPAVAAAEPAVQESPGSLGVCMDAGASSAPMRVPVLRQHFHEFMLDLHARLHALQQARPRVVMKSRDGMSVYRYGTVPQHPVDACAREIASGAVVLCLDELHVTSVADAMILPRLFARLLEHGTYIVFTSNRPPRDLYKGGLSYPYFAPFVRMASGLLLLVVEAGRDYRAMRMQQGAEGRLGHEGLGGPDSEVASQGQWLSGIRASERMHHAWAQALSRSHGSSRAGSGSSGGGGQSDGIDEEGGSVAACPRTLASSYGRSLWVPMAGGKAGMLSFEQLCGEYGLQPPPHDRSSPRPLAPADYLSLCRALPILFISDVPMLGADQRDAARRWVSFLDVAYEAGVTLTCSSESGSVEGVFAGLLAAAGLQGQDTSLGKAQGQVKGSAVPVTSKLVQGLRAQAQAQAAAAVGIVHAPQPAALGHVDAWLEASRRSATVAPVSWLLAEEVLMYHRAASRLAEMCGPSA